MDYLQMGWEKRPRDVWKPLGPYEISHGLIWEKMTPTR